MALEVVKRKAHLGIALDSDADRVVVAELGGLPLQVPPPYTSA